MLQNYECIVGRSHRRICQYEPMQLLKSHDWIAEIFKFYHEVSNFSFICLYRFVAIFCSSNSTNLLLFIGIITIMLAGAAAIFEIDIKKVIALSTLRQLGVIIIILGGAEPVLSFFHLLRHAYFKAILFICAGIIIHNIKDYQDIRKIRIISNMNAFISRN